MALDGAVLERDIEGKVPATDCDARRLAWDERHRDADVYRVAEQFVGIE